MHIKRYTMASLFFIVLVGWYIFAYITQDTISIDFFGVQLPSLSIALWIIIPLIVLYIVSMLHMSFYSMIESLKLRKYEKDYEKYIDSLIEAYLGKITRKNTYKTDRYSFLGALLDNTKLFPTDSLKSDTSNEKINNVMDIINNIKQGNVVDLKKYSLTLNNEMVIQNERNRFKSGEITAEDILNHSHKYAISLCEEIYVEHVKTASLNMIEKYKKFLTKKALLVILSRVNAEEHNIEITNDALIALFDKIELEKEDFMTITSILSKGIVPEQRMKLFEILTESNEKAMDSYLFTLFDLEILEPAYEILDNSQDDEYINFKAYRALKENNQTFSLSLFV